jgi:hypothetical protein
MNALEVTMRLVHRPTELDAVQWTGDLDAVRAFVGPEIDVQVEGSGLLWIVEGPNVFPVALNHWVVLWPNGRVAAMSDEMLRRLYQPKLEVVSA